MNEHETHSDADNGIDEDRTEGSMKQMGGKIKEGAGKLFGDEKLRGEGEADQAEGKVQNAWGSAKDKARETFDSGNERESDD